MIEHDGFWASVYKSDGTIRDVVYAENIVVAKKILFAQNTPELNDLLEIKPVVVRVI
ncbi:hypothetical protein ACI2KR_30055 [Pseudomonas luteola]